MRRFLPVFAVLLMCALGAAAQEKSNSRLYVVTYVDVYPNFAAGATDALKQFAAASRKDAGFVRFEFMKDVVRTNHFAIVEVWQSRAAYEAHLTAPHNKKFRETIQPWLGSPFDERLYNLVE